MSIDYCLALIQWTFSISIFKYLVWWDPIRSATLSGVLLRRLTLGWSRLTLSINPILRWFLFYSLCEVVSLCKVELEGSLGLWLGILVYHLSTALRRIKHFSPQRQGASVIECPQFRRPSILTQPLRFDARFGGCAAPCLQCKHSGIGSHSLGFKSSYPAARSSSILDNVGIGWGFNCEIA